MYQLESIDGLPAGERRRVLLLFELPDAEYFNARKLLLGERFKSGKHRLGLSPREVDRVKSWLQMWINNLPVKAVHTWQKTQYNGRYCGCYSVEHRDVRIVGFSGHYDVEDGRMESLVLMHAFAKHEWDFQERILDGVVVRRDDENVAAAIRKFLGVAEKGGKK